VILLDTNVVSEIMRPRPQPSVVDWLNRQSTDLLYISTITLAEIHYGLDLVPSGRRKAVLSDRFELFIQNGFTQRIVSFDELSARLYGELMGRRQKMGRPLSSLDGQIAAIARANKCGVATRNHRDFELCGLEIVNPFLD